MGTLILAIVGCAIIVALILVYMKPDEETPPVVKLEQEAPYKVEPTQDCCGSCQDCQEEAPVKVVKKRTYKKKIVKE